MSEIPFHTRRATLDDLPALRGLWQTAMLPAEKLERHLREFHLIEGSDGRLIGAVGFQIRGIDARIYGEAFTHLQTENLIKPQLLDLMKKMATGAGVHRIWTNEHSAFGDEVDFHIANSDLLKRHPPDFEGIGNWRVMTLRDEKAERRINEEIGIFQAATEDERSQRAIYIKWIRRFISLIAMIFSLILIYFALKILANLPKFQ